MSASINISSCFENPQSALADAFRRRNLDAFKSALIHLHADPNLVDTKIKLSIFEKILSTPNTSDYIRLCIENGADMHKRNDRGRYPLHYVVDSLCPKNLETFLSFYDLTKINVKLANKNCLHILIGMLPSENYENIADCIKILIENGCDPNMPNEKSQTPFFSLLRIQHKLKDQNDLVDFFLKNSSIDVYTYSKKNAFKEMFEEKNPGKSLPAKIDKTVDSDFMLSLLRASNETEFQVNFKLFKELANQKQNDAADENKANSYAEDCATFMYTAAQNGLENVVELLVEDGVDVNKRAANCEGKNPPVFLACASGYYRILEIILKAKIKPETVHNKRNLLHEVCRHFGMDPSSNPRVNFQNCFNLVINHCDVNQKDEQGCTPLHYAVRYRNDEAVKSLLQKSSYVGTKNIFGETPTDDMNREAFEDFLDDCISTNVRKTGDEEHKIFMNYNFLKAPAASKNEEEFRPEIAPLQNIADNSDLRPLILHPVLSSFLYLKWSKLSKLFYGNLIMFSIFMVSLIIYIVLCQSIAPKERNDDGWYCLFYILSVISLIVLMLREMFQMILSFKNYIKSPINWFEIVLIILGWTVLIQSSSDEPDTHQRILRAVTILFAAYEFLQLVGTLPILSVSTHMVILKRVSITFLKSIGLYSILLLAFALCFYTLFGGKHAEEMVEKAASNLTDSGESKSCCDHDNDGDAFNSFGYPGIAIIKTFVMLTGEFDASSLDLDRNGASYCIIFLLFVFLVTIVLFNLLNALAVDDTHVIKSEGELVDLCQRINVLNKYEKIILSRSGSWHWLKSIISVFPYTIPDGNITILPNKSNEVLALKSRETGNRDISIKIDDVQEQELQNLNNNGKPARTSPGESQKISSMDPKIMKKIRCVLEARNDKAAQAKRDGEVTNRIRSIESQLKYLTDLLTQRNS